MKVRLNLATKALETHRRFLAVSGVIGLIAGLTFLGLGWNVYSVRKSEAALRAKTEQVRQELIAMDRQRTDLERFFAQPENARLHDRSAFLNTIIDEQSLNWTQMFMDLEKILPAGVRLVSIEPNHQKDRVEIKLIVAASSEEAELKFLNSLENSKAFAHVQLISEKPPSQQANGVTDRVEAELTAIYLRS
jgi:type IV pilus assembly protein PilN